MKQSLWVILLLVMIFPSAAAQTTYTLSDAIAHGLEHSPRLKEADYKISGAENERKAARGGFMPRVSAGYTRGYLTSLSAKGPTEEDYLDQVNDNFHVNLSQVLYDGARILNEFQRAEAQKEMYEAQKEMTRIRLVFEIETAFFRLMKAKTDVAAAEDVVQRLESGEEAVLAFFEREMVPYVQVLEVKSELVSAVSDLSVAKNRVSKEKAVLLSLLNVQPVETILFEGGLDQYPSEYTIDFDRVWQVALDARPDLVSLEKQKIMARKEAEMATSRYHPRISLDAGYFDTDRDYDAPGVSTTGTFDRDQRNRYWQAKISLQWELFDGGSAWYTRKKHLDQIRALAEQVVVVENNIRAELENALLTITEASDRIHAIAQAVEMGEEYYSAESERLEKGVSSMPSVLDALARLTRLRANYDNARFDYQLAMANLNFLMGTRNPVEIQQK